MAAPVTGGNARRAVRALVAALALAAVALPALPGGAVASSYTVWSCRGPADEPLTARAWQLGGSPITQMVDSCLTGGAFKVFVPAGRSGTWVDDGGARFQTLGGGTIASYRLWRSTTIASLTPTAGFYTAVVEDDYLGPEPPFLDMCVGTTGSACSGVGVEHDRYHSNNLFTGGPVTSVTIAAGCSAPRSGPSCVPSVGVDAAVFTLHRAAFEITDADSPRVDPAPSGDLLGGEPVAGTQIVTVPAIDDGAGVHSAQARLDGVPVADVAVGGDCREPYTRPSPCPAAVELRLAIDTTKVPDGVHRLEIAVADGAGNTAVVLDRPVRIENPPPPAPPAPPIVVPPPAPPVVVPPVVIVRDPPPPAVRGDYAVTLAPKRVRAGSRATLSGRVVDRDGRPLPDAKLVVERRGFGPLGGDWTELRTIAADARGRFRLRAPARAQQLRVRLLPERAATTAFHSSAVDVVSRLRLRVAARPRALRNGRTLRLSGRLLGAHGAARGKQLLVQAIVGGHWQTVDRVRAHADGGFTWRYRFQRTEREALYSFRVVASADDDRWPWRKELSPRLRVRVRP